MEEIDDDDDVGKREQGAGTSRGAHTRPRIEDGSLAEAVNLVSLDALSRLHQSYHRSLLF